MFRCTGSKRISIVIQDKKQKYLIVKAKKSEELEFPRFSASEYEMPADDIEYVKAENIKLSRFEVSGIARKRPEGGCEIVVGHTRRHICEIVGLKTSVMQKAFGL